MVQIVLSLFSTYTFVVNGSCLTEEIITKELQKNNGLKFPSTMSFLYTFNGYPFQSINLSTVSLPLLYIKGYIRQGLCGGKGGFGAMLRSQGKGRGANSTINYGACRDLQGRRLRHANQEIALKKYLERFMASKKAKTDLKTDYTADEANGWYLSLPSWAENIHRNKRQSKRKTEMCVYWLKAHQKGEIEKIPKNAPKWYGCIRKDRCGYAHGVEELVGPKAVEYKEKEKIEQINKKEKLLEKYNQMTENVKEEMAHALAKGRKKRRKYQFVENEKEVEQEVEKKEKQEKQEKNDIDNGNITIEEYLACISGEICLLKDGEIEGISLFGSMVIHPCALSSGKWYYEVKILSDGLIQLGWCTSQFEANDKEGQGVGDDAHSWGYDGLRKYKFHKEKEEEYGKTAWKVNDIIGCYLNLDDNYIKYSINGLQLGRAYDNIKDVTNVTNVTNSQAEETYSPAFSLDENESIQINIGQSKFKYLNDTEGYVSVLSSLPTNQRRNSR